MIYPNGAKISTKLSKKLETIPGDSSSDRTYMNTQFFVVFSEKYLKKQVKKGLSRKDALSKFRDSNRYEIMKGWLKYKKIFPVIDKFLFTTDLYEHRVLRNGQGDIEARKRLFKSCFRTKLNNWWNSNAANALN